MNENELMSALFEKVKEHLDEEKVFIENPQRIREIDNALSIAEELFSHCKVKINDDPLQMGALILSIEGFDMVVRGEREIKLFSEMISNADNFEVYPSNGNVKFAAVFQAALTRI